jgi:hypothetical protein
LQTVADLSAAATAKTAAVAISTLIEILRNVFPHVAASFIDRMDLFSRRTFAHTQEAATRRNGEKVRLHELGTSTCVLGGSAKRADARRST